MARVSGDMTVPDAPGANRDRPDGLPHRYRLLDVIGEGGMGRVFRAHDATLGRDVAIKVIEKDLPGSDKTQQRVRFVREARAAARLAHPNIVAVHDVDPDAGWLVMELVEGESLRETVARGPSAPALVRRIAEQVLAALDAAHAAGVVHRDIKPSNIIIDRAGKITLVDFGVARLVDAELTRTGESLGTPAYMAPEQVRGTTVDERTDLYGLGATLYELVTRERMVAFESPSNDSLAQLDAACPGEPGLARLIGRCLQARPEDRFASARDALAALTNPASRSRQPRRWRGLAIALGALAGAAIAGAVWRARSHRAEDPRKLELFSLAQRGEYQKSSLIIDDYLADHPDDADVLTFKLLTYWWTNGRIDHPDKPMIEPRLPPPLRAMVHGIDLMSQKRDDEAIAFLEDSERRYPDSVELTYAVGEARWHGHHFERGVAALERAFSIDPRWQMALHHVVEYRLGRDEAAQLQPIADKLRPIDPAAAAALDCRILIGERKYREAAAGAHAALERQEPIPELYNCLSNAQVLAGDLDGSEQTAKTALDRWPIDLREWGASAMYAEAFLYRGRLDEFLELDKATRQRSLALAMWRPTPDLFEGAPLGPGMRTPPLTAATWILVEQLHGRDGVAVYDDYPDPEIRSYGRALWAEVRGDTKLAITEYRKGIAAPAKGDVRMLLAHHLARVLHAGGDTAGAVAACEEIVSPRMYIGYRAIVLPDCLLWSEDRASWQRLVDAWKGKFEHPAVVEARRRLAAP